MPPFPDVTGAVAAARNLFTDPLWRPEDLGKAIPDAPHAVSVALPRWRDVIGYEEKDPRVLEAMAVGYPRFFLHPMVQALFQQCERRFAAPGECAVAFPSAAVAERCAHYLTRKTGCDPRIYDMGADGVHALTFPQTAFDTAKKFWRHAGEIVSSRQAEGILEGFDGEEEGRQAKRTLSQRLAEWAGALPENVYLFPSGMAPLYSCQRMVAELGPSGGRSIQLGFPYVDLLKIQNELGEGVHFLPAVDSTVYEQIEALLTREPITAVFCELPGNPMLQSVDLPRLAELLRRRRVPLIVDETLGTFANIDVLPYADAVTTSLTKYVAGQGDVMGGSLILSTGSPHAGRFRDWLDQHFEDLLWSGDAIVLEQYSRDFQERVARMNDNTERLCDALIGHPAVARVLYPKYTSRDAYRQVLKPGGGYSGLLSFELNNAPDTAPAFYDGLRVSKGPSLGTVFSLVCPYMLLAHYDELDWTEGLGISRYLIRVSVGLEDPDDLIARFTEALNASSSG
jgi:cystathionine gamma-synthase